MPSENEPFSTRSLFQHQHDYSSSVWAAPALSEIRWKNEGKYGIFDATSFKGREEVPQTNYANCDENCKVLGRPDYQYKEKYQTFKS